MSFRLQQVINDANYLGHQECLNDQQIEILIQLSANIRRHRGVCYTRNLKYTFIMVYQLLQNQDFLLWSSNVVYLKYDVRNDQTDN